MAGSAPHHHPLATANAPACAGSLLDLLARWAPGGKVRYRILVDNPAQLYGF